VKLQAVEIGWTGWSGSAGSSGKIGWTSDASHTGELTAGAASAGDGAGAAADKMGRKRTARTTALRIILALVIEISFR
jgi:hypothetical protein